MKSTPFIAQNVSSAPDDKQYTGGLSRLRPHTTSAPNKRSNLYHHIPGIVRVIAKVKAHVIVRGVKSALNEVELIEKGLKTPKSLDQLLNPGFCI